MPLQKSLSDLGIPMSKQKVDVVSKVIHVERLFTRYRGVDSEQVWQDSITKICDATFAISTWTPLPGYPQGEIGEPTPEQSEQPESVKPDVVKSTKSGNPPKPTPKPAAALFGQNEIEL